MHHNPLAAKLVNANVVWVFDIPHTSQYLYNTVLCYFLLFFSQRKHNFDLA